MSHASAQNWKLQALLDEWLCEPAPDMSISGVSLDSRLVQAGDLYLAVGGAVTHGIRFAEAAVSAGACAVAVAPDIVADFSDSVEALQRASVPVLLIENLDQLCATIASRFYGHPDQDMTLIAVTGTDGKTSVCRFICQAFAAANRPCGYIGTLGWGLGDSLQPIALTTPDAVSLRRMLASLRDAGAELVALEASSHGLAEGRLNGLSLNIAVLTNLGRDHLDYHKSVEAYKQAKARLFDWSGLECSVVNGCDQLGQELLHKRSPVRKVAYFSRDAQGSNDLCTAANPVASCLYAKEIEATDEGLSFQLLDEGFEGVVTTRLLGRFNVDNLLACYGSLRACGMAANEAVHCLSRVTPVDGRMERLGGAGQPAVVVDFSHTPQALSVAIDAARVHCSGRLWVIFGCGGDRDPGKRAPMAAAAEAADCVILTDDNPRTESSQSIIEQALLGFENPSAVTVIADRAAAIEHAVSSAQPGDLVLIAGKGHEEYQIVGTQRLPFSDREHALSALERAS